MPNTSGMDGWMECLSQLGTASATCGPVSGDAVVLLCSVIALN
jgi:hypothetical protein